MEVMESLEKKTVFSIKSTRSMKVFSRRNFARLGQTLKVAFLSGYVAVVAVLFVTGIVPVVTGPSWVDAASSEELIIDSIGLETVVEEVELKNRVLDVPEKVAGSYTQARNKMFIFGHSSTVFQNLSDVMAGSEIEYGGKIYEITEKEVTEKSEINMDEILETEKVDTIVLMTCAGTPITDTDYTHRLIVTAVAK